MQYIYVLWWMILLWLFDLCCLKTCECESQAWKKYIYVCEMQFVVDVTIKDFNWYVMIIMMILIWDDVVNKDHVNMNWYYWWICEYEMRLLLLLIMSLRWDDIYVVNNMEMECWLMLEMHWHVHFVYVWFHLWWHWAC